MRMSNVLGLLALACLLLGIGELAGLWWAVLVAGPVLGWFAWVAHTYEVAQVKADAELVAQVAAARERR